MKTYCVHRSDVPRVKPQKGSLYLWKQKILKRQTDKQGIEHIQIADIRIFQKDRGTNE